MVRSPVGTMMMKSGSGGKLGAPATRAAFAHAADRLGFDLPAPLQQLCNRRRRIRTGRHRAVQPCRSADTPSDADQRAPMGRRASRGRRSSSRSTKAIRRSVCLDLESGKVVVYDPERIEDMHGGAWRRSFVAEHRSIAGLLEAWLAAPSLADQLESQERKCERQTDLPWRAFSDPALQADAELITTATCRRAAPPQAYRRPGGRTKSADSTDLFEAVKKGRPPDPVPTRQGPATAVRTARSADPGDCRQWSAPRHFRRRRRRCGG